MSRAIPGMILAAASLLAIGCQSEPGAQPAYLDVVPTRNDLIDSQRLVNDTKLGSVTPPVRAAFQHDFPDVAIASISSQMSATGQLLYRITFLTSRATPDSVIYNDSGTIVQQPTTVVPVPADITITPAE